MMISKLLPLTLFLLLPSVPDEGQWLPNQLREMDWEQLKARGMELSKDEFWHPEKGGVLSAAVQINGCSASFVSKEGLIVTNHHCGFGAVQNLSTVEQNYLQDGFVANSRQEELPAKGMVAFVFRGFDDVTEQVHAEQAKANTALERYRVTRSLIQQLVAQGEQQPNTACQVTSFLEGREYHLEYRTRLTDVRLVYAPPRNIGEYGGETDNWEWPRHTGDFCFFRAYVSAEGLPAAYAEDNVPCQPAHHLKVSTQGVQEGDLALILGYPGRTERYLSADAVADRQGVFYPMRLELYTDIIHIIEEETVEDAAKALGYSSLIKSLANVQKNALGMVKGLARNATVEHKMNEETLFSQWVQQDEQRQKKYGEVLADLQQLDATARQTQQKDLLLTMLLSSRTCGFFRNLVDMAGAMGSQRGEGDPEYPASFVQAVLREDVHEDLLSIQARILGRLLDEANALPAEQQIMGVAEFMAKGSVTSALQESSMTSVEGRKEVLMLGAKGLRESKDPLLQLAWALAQERWQYVRRQQENQGRRLVVGQQWIEAQQQWRGKTFYPDANSTLRVSIASVKGYKPRDGVQYNPHTTVAGLLDKHTGKNPFDCPEILRTAAKNRSTSRFYSAKIGDVPVCFLTDGDTTGGNSGSPVINGKGELVGLNFDRAFESVSGDYGWNPERSRNISVDIRYVLWILEQVMPAKHLLKEMGV